MEEPAFSHTEPFTMACFIICRLLLKLHLHQLKLNLPNPQVLLLEFFHILIETIYG